MLTCHYVLGVSKVTPVLKIWEYAEDLTLCTKVKELAVVENILSSSQALHVLPVAVFILRNMSVFWKEIVEQFKVKDFHHLLHPSSGRINKRGHVKLLLTECFNIVHTRDVKITPFFFSSSDLEGKVKKLSHALRIKDEKIDEIEQR